MIYIEIHSGLKTIYTHTHGLCSKPQHKPESRMHWNRSFWRNFHHWLHWKMSFRQLPVQPVMKISGGGGGGGGGGNSHSYSFYIYIANTIYFYDLKHPPYKIVINFRWGARPVRPPLNPPLHRCTRADFCGCKMITRTVRAYIALIGGDCACTSPVRTSTCSVKLPPPKKKPKLSLLPRIFWKYGVCSETSCQNPVFWLGE